MSQFIKIRGARQHNLKNIKLDIPKDKLVVITGVSGSGKSSLAFDTIYAEGQRRYVESLSAYARQFLGIMDKPDVDSIEGLSPSISIDQKTVSHNPRSTVGTITEVYDFMRLLFARIGRPHCPNCGIEITKLSIDEIVDKILQEVKAKITGDKTKTFHATILSPVVRQKKGEFRDLFDNLRSKGFYRIRLDKKETDLSENPALLKTHKHDIEAVIDNMFLSFKEIKDEVAMGNLRTRLSSSVEQSINLSQGLIIFKIEEHERLYSERFSCPRCNLALPEIEPRMFSFNSPTGACENCRGLGTVYKVDPERVLNPELSVNEGGITPLNRLFFADTWYARLVRHALEEEGIDLNAPIKNLTPAQRKIILYGTDKVYQVRGTNRFGNDATIKEPFEGIARELERRFFNTQASDFAGMEVQKYMREEVCESCLGARLRPEVLAITINGRHIAAVADQTVEDNIAFARRTLREAKNEYEATIAKPIVKEIETRLSFLKNVGLGYLTVSRAAKTLSGGELQRIRLASQLGTGLTGVLYVLDEPSIGLHPKDVSALVDTLKDLKSLGNTLIVVEHDQETIESADYLIELGPQAGRHGGHLVFEGTVAQMKKSGQSMTGQFLSGKRQIRMQKRELETKRGRLVLEGAKENNLKNVNLELPLGNLIAVTGVSGSGKSTLIVDTLYPALKYYLDGYFSEKIGAFGAILGTSNVNRVYLVDQSPIGRTPRSNPATYIGFFDEIRDLFASTPEAKERGFQKGRFSFNLKGGRCEKCEGAGVNKIEMQFLSDVYVTCDVCEGKRYNQETLAVRYKGKTIYEVLKMSVEEALDFFKNHASIHVKLRFLKEVGLDYIELGQPAPTFSGGEAQRMKLVNELSRRDSGKTVYILDEPTTGLHFYDVEKLMRALYDLVERGNTVIVIEHNLDVVKNSQYIVDLGPNGGRDGGTILYQGELNGILKAHKSHTGKYLKDHLGRDKK